MHNLEVGQMLTNATHKFLSLLFLLMLVSYTWAEELPFETIQLQKQQIAQERIWDGVVEAVNQATLSAQTGGRIAQINVDVDDFVQQGAIILRFTNTEQEAGLKQAKSALEEASVNAQHLQSEYERISEVYSKKLVSKSVFDQAKSQRDASKAKVASATAAVKVAQQTYDYTIVRAPFSGIVTKRHVELGETVNPGQPLISGLSLNKLRVKVDLPQSLINRVRIANQGEIILQNKQQRIKAESITFFPYADPASKTFQVRLNLPDVDTGLYPGMWVKAGFVIGQTEALMVPADSIIQRSELRAVYVISQNQQPSLRQVRLGQKIGNKIEILSGLSAGETIALDPISASVYLAQFKAAKQ